MEADRIRFKSALANRDEALCRRLFHPEFVEYYTDYDFDNLVFLWPICKDQTLRKLTLVVMDALQIGHKQIAQFVLSVLPARIDDKILASVLLHDAPRYMIAHFVENRKSVFTHVKDWGITGVKERTAILLIEAGFGRKLRPDDCNFSFAFMSQNAETMAIQEFIQAPRRGLSGPSSLLVISLCGVMPSKARINKFIRTLENKCFNDVPRDYLLEVPRAIARIRIYYADLGIDIVIPEVKLRAIN